MSIVETSLSNAVQNVTLTQEPEAQGLTLQDFYAYMPTHQYIAAHSAALWPRVSVNSQVPPLTDTGGNAVPATDWLDRHRPIEALVWVPGEPQVIHGRLMLESGWIEARNSACFNLYRSPAIPAGDPDQAGPWIDHVRKLYPDEADHLMRWFAYKIQFPGEKVNHAVVLGGRQGVGKDVLLEPVKRAVGEGNVAGIAPKDVIDKFNGFVQSVLLVINEATDLGELDGKTFYEASKTLIAAPPHVIQCNVKFRPHRNVQNVCGVVITTNHKTDGIYLHPDDRRHFVAWSPVERSDFAADYFLNLHRWYESGGYGHVAAFLRAMDLSDFDAKAPPPKTAAFWEIVQSDQAPEDAELADSLDRLGRPEAVTISTLAAAAKGLDLAYWLQDKRSRRQIPHRLETAGYVQVRNDAASDGLWRVGGKRQAVYARKDLLARARVMAADALCRGGR